MKAYVVTCPFRKRKKKKLILEFILFLFEKFESTYLVKSVKIFACYNNVNLQRNNV